MSFHHRLTLWMAMAIAMTCSSVANAAAPQVKSQAPGYYRMMLGDFEITALSDGTFGFPAGKMMGNISPQKLASELSQNFLNDPVEESVNGFLINTGTKLILIDTGAAQLVAPTLGYLVNNLKASGYQPEQVDEVYITHMHRDHVGGLMDADELAFPNAIVRADQHDVDYWLSQANLDAAPLEAKQTFLGARASINPYIKAGKFKSFNGETEFSPGIKATSSYGHTAGHTTYVIESKGKKLVIWGDLMHVASVQFQDPSVVMKFDTDNKTAAVERKKAFADAAKQGCWIAGAHIPFPGLGHLRAEGKGYFWIPVNYSALK